MHSERANNKYLHYCFITLAVSKSKSQWADFFGNREQGAVALTVESAPRAIMPTYVNFVNCSFSTTNENGVVLRGADTTV